MNDSAKIAKAPFQREAAPEQHEAVTQPQSGQVSLMMGMMMLTFIVFFAFVINVGMLVNAKINLQNAADMAAYSGAAVQARQLNHISLLNYEMRRQLKKYLFRYYVMGNMALKGGTKLKSGDDPSPRKYIADQGGKSLDYGAPVVCIITNNMDNFCQLADLQPIPVVPASFQDSVNEALRQVQQQAEGLRQKNCNQIGKVNRMALGLWLWNTDPELKNIDNDLKATSGSMKPEQVADAQATLTIVKGLSHGLGLVPKLLLLAKRVRTLETYVNDQPRTLTLAAVNKLEAAGDVMKKERSIQAFYSAYYSLGNHTFSDESKISLDELIPGSENKATLLKLTEKKIGFDAFFMDMHIDKDKIDADGKVACEARPVAFAVGSTEASQVPVAFSKDLKTLTYYAVRLRAPAKLLFNPFGADMELTAYAAAQPFGSRIGPQESMIEGDFATTSVAPQLAQCAGAANAAAGAMTAGSGGGTCIGQLPNLRMTEAGTSWMSEGAQGSFYGAMLSAGATNGTGQVKINSDLLEKAYQMAMIPNPIEQTKYNIPADLETDPFLSYFNNSEKAYAFWAPIQSPDEKGGDDPKELLNSIFSGVSTGAIGDETPGAAGGEGTDYQALFGPAFYAGFERYITEGLKTGNGEDHDGFDIARIVDPFSTRPDGAGGPVGKISVAPLSADDPKKSRSSWNDVRDGKFVEAGRIGYSVKYVSFKTLLTRNQSSDGGTSWTNTPKAIDSIAENDFPKLSH